MEAWIIILIVLAVLALLAVGGALAQRRRMAANRTRFTANLDRVNNDLAAAHAEDKGWDPDRLRAAARHALQEHGGGARDGDPTLVAVIDPPGTEDDKAIFELAGGRQLTPGRRGDDWIFEGLR